VKFKIEKKIDETVKNVNQNLKVKKAGGEILVIHERAKVEMKYVSDRPSRWNSLKCFNISPEAKEFPFSVLLLQILDSFTDN
jgi:hypothetical protein